MKLKKKKKKTIAKIHGIGTFAQYVQIKNYGKELQPKTVAALRDYKQFGYVLFIFISYLILFHNITCFILY